MNANYYTPIWALNQQMEKDAKRGRPKCLRKVESQPKVDYFKPRGIPLTQLETVKLTLEELEAIRLVDYDGLEQEDSAKKVRVSRRTLTRDLKSGRMKIADALLNGKAIEIRGGYFLASGERLYACAEEGHQWKEAAGNKKPGECPTCGSKKIRKKRG